MKGNNDICKYLTKSIESSFVSLVTNVEFNSNYWIITLNNKDKVYFKNLILTCPFPQLKNLSLKFLNKKILNLAPKMTPNITVMVAYKNCKKIPVSSIKFNDKIIAWAAHENAKNRFISNQSLWTIQCTEKFSKKNIDIFKKNKKKYQTLILKKFETLTGYPIKKVVFQNIHGWKYAYSKTKTKVSSVWLKKSQLGICADWFTGSKGENSWLSAMELFDTIKKSRHLL